VTVVVAALQHRSARRLRILLANDHALVRRGLRMVVDSQPDLEVLDEVGDGAQAVERAVQCDVDPAILDVTMPRMTGLAATRELAHRRPELRAWLGLILGGLLIGSLWGALFGFFIHRMGNGQHDFSSLRSLAASRYDVIVADAYADRAKQLLSPLA